MEVSLLDLYGRYQKSWNMSGCFSHGNIMGLSIVISHHKNCDNTGIITIFNGNHRKTRKENGGFKGFTSRDLPSGNLLHSELEKKHHVLAGKTHYFNGYCSIAILDYQRVYDIWNINVGLNCG